MNKRLLLISVSTVCLIILSNFINHENKQLYGTSLDKASIQKHLLAQSATQLEYEILGQKIPLTVKKDTTAVVFKPQKIDRGSGGESYHIQLQEHLTRSDRSSGRESEVEITPLGQNYALVKLAVEDKDISAIEADIRKPDYVQEVLPVLTLSNGDSETARDIILPNEIIVSFDAQLSEAERKAILKENNLELIRPVRFSSDLYIVKSLTASGVEVLQVANELNSVTSIQSASPNFIETFLEEISPLNPFLVAEGSQKENLALSPSSTSLLPIQWHLNSSPLRSCLNSVQTKTIETITECSKNNNLATTDSNTRYVWVISKDSFTSHELPSRKEIETLAREYSEPFLEDDKDKKEEFVKSAGKLKKLTLTGKKLSELILPPDTEATEKPRVVIVSDGALQYIPFASLPTENNNLLSKRHQIVNLPSSSVLASLRTNQTRKRSNKKQIAILADPVFSKSDIRLPQKQVPGTENLEDENVRSAIYSSDLKLSRLTGTRQEAEAIVAFVPQSERITVYDWNANLEFATSPELSNYNIVHFATHGILDSERPQLSSIVLSLFDEQGKPQNGFLRLHEVFNLNVPADLVVLSACETGLGKEIKGEGLVGLTRGFMYAGATRVLVSLWKVDDAATAEFMTQFYRLMLQDDLTPAEALNATQRYMQEHPDWNHPYYWAAFTLQGDWVGMNASRAASL